MWVTAKNRVSGTYPSIGVATVLTLSVAAILWTLPSSPKRAPQVVELTPSPTATPPPAPIAPFIPRSAPSIAIGDKPTEDPDKLPTFFPPRATDSLVLPLQLTGEQLTLEDLSARLTHALQNAGYWGKCSYYWLDDRHGPGFAMVTHIERIEPDGKPVLDQRWGFGLPRYGKLTLATMLKALIHADPGRYRLLALVVCKQPLVEKDTTMTMEQVTELNAGPKWLGDSPWKTVVTTADFHLIAYVYEFERPSRSDAPALMSSSDVTVERHLESTGLYDDIRREFSK